MHSQKTSNRRLNPLPAQRLELPARTTTPSEEFESNLALLEHRMVSKSTAMEELMLRLERPATRFWGLNE